MTGKEVGCKRFFSMAVYVSNPRHTSLKVWHYKALAILKHNIQKIFIDKDWLGGTAIFKDGAEERVGHNGSLQR
jgi:hypothetical protein